jgi:hypothetical protein
MIPRCAFHLKYSCGSRDFAIIRSASRRSIVETFRHTIQRVKSSRCDKTFAHSSVGSCGHFDSARAAFVTVGLGECEELQLENYRICYMVANTEVHGQTDRCATKVHPSRVLVMPASKVTTSGSCLESFRGDQPFCGSQNIFRDGSFHVGTKVCL